MNQAATSLNFHPYKLETRDHIASYVSEFIKVINPQSIRTLSLPGNSFDFESLPKHNLYHATNLKQITNVCVERNRETFLTSPVQVPIENRELADRLGDSAIHSYTYAKRVEISTHYVFDDVKNVLGINNGSRGYRWEDSTVNYNGESIEMDLVWLDYYGSYDNDIGRQLRRFANYGSALTGLIFVTFECRGRHATQFNKANAPQRDSGSSVKAQYQAEEVKSDLNRLEKLNQVLYIEYVGEGNTPMVLVGFSWQKKRELSSQRGETIPVHVMKSFHGGEQWRSITNDIKKELKKAAKEARPKPNDDQNRQLDEIAYTFYDPKNKGPDADDEMDECLRIHYPELEKYVPVHKTGDRAGKNNWDGRKKNATVRRKKERGE